VRAKSFSREPKISAVKKIFPPRAEDFSREKNFSAA